MESKKKLIKAILILNIIIFSLLILAIAFNTNAMDFFIGITQIAIFVMSIIALLNLREK